MNDRMRTVAWGVAWAALAVSVVTAGAAQAQEQGPPPAPVAVAPVVRGNVAATFPATGTVVSRNDARLAAEVAGRLDWVAEPGARIAKGAPVARVDARALELRLREDDAQISRLTANAELLETQLSRLTALPQGIASQSQIDEASARLAMARHELDQARATRDSTRHAIARATIRGPFTGYVAERIRQLGEFVAAGTEVIRLTDTENVEVVARIPVAEAGHLAIGQGVTVQGGGRDQASKIRAIVRDPKTADKLMPDHFVMTKRPILENGYWETYNRANVTLVDLREDPIERFTPTSVVTRTGEHPIDMLVLATGFDAISGSMLRLNPKGRGGVSLKERWRDRFHNYLGLTIGGFPNLFMITGPGSPSVKSNMIISIEQHVDLVTDSLLHMRAHGLAVIEPEREAEDGWVEHVQEAANRTLFPLANSWYMGSNIPGKPRLFTPYIGGVGRYRQICEQIVADGYKGFRFEAKTAAATPKRTAAG